MKVDNLLGPYLYQHKQLSLPGIGMFTLDEKAVLPDDNAKIKVPIEGIAFNPKTGVQLDDSLIQFIKVETGKMKALAEADLYSFIATAFQFLNIGKPFYFEGIGTLQKNKDGAYNFTAGTVIPQKLEDSLVRYSDTSKKSTYNSDAEAARGSSFNASKLLVVAGILITVGLIGWGGYYLYAKNTGGDDMTPANQSTPVTTDTTAVKTAALDSSGKMPDSLRHLAATDTSAATRLSSLTDSAGAAASSVKFIFETTDKKARALKRYEQLKDVTILKAYNNKVAMETTDSLSFKIYTIVTCPPADTSHVKQLLNAWYYGTKAMKVKIDR